MQYSVKICRILMLCTIIKQSLHTSYGTEIGTSKLTMFKDMESDCNTYCFGIVKPILQQTKQHQFMELQDKIQELNKIIKSTESQLSSVQIKFGVCEDATKNREILSNEQINRKTTQLKELQTKYNAQETKLKSVESQASGLQARIGVCEEAVKNREIQYAQLLDLNASCNNSSIIKDELMNTIRALIDKQKAAAQADIIKFELKDNKIKELEMQLKSKEKLILEQKSRLSSHTVKFKQLTDQINDFKEQLNHCQSSSCLGKTTDVHVIRVAGIDPFPVFCDSVLADPGWTVIQRRRDGTVNFNRNWTDYRLGFGDLRSEFFIGLEKLHLMTKSQHHELYIYLQDFDNENRYAHYDHFLIANESDSYKLLELGEYRGTAGDAFIAQKNMKFSALDRDNDKSPDNCAREFKSGWWYRQCYYCNLNGQYFNARKTNRYGINWFAWHKNSLQFVQMMIRPKPH